MLILDTAEADDAFNTAVETFIRMPRKVAHPLVPVQGSPTPSTAPSFWIQGLIISPYTQCIWKPCFPSGLRWWTSLSTLSHESRIVGYLCPPFSHARFADLLHNVPPFPASPHVSKTIDRVVAVVNEHSSRVVTVVTSSEKEAEELYLPHFAPAAQVHDDRYLSPSDLARFFADAVLDFL